MAMRRIGEVAASSKMQRTLRRDRVAEENVQAKPPRAGQSFHDDRLRTRIPNAWLRGETLTDLTANETVTFLRLYFAALRTARWSPDRVWDTEFTLTLKEIACATFSIRQAIRTIHSLKQKHYIYIVKKRKGRKEKSRENRYFLAPKARQSATSKA